MPDISQPLVDRLAKICGRLGSDFDGERAAAALLASGLLRQHGVTWVELIAAAAPGQAHLERRVQGEGWRHTIELCLDREEALTPWEVEFLRGVEQQRRDCPTSKQQSILERTPPPASPPHRVLRLRALPATPGDAAAARRCRRPLRQS